MMKNYFLELANYNIWANNKCISWLQQISEEQWNQPIVSSFGSIAGNALHLAAAEKIWLDRLNNVAVPIWLATEFKGTREELLPIWEKASQDLKTYLQNMDENGFDEKLKFKRINGDAFEMPLWQVFAHVFNHSTMHRGQFVTMLRQIGFEGVGSTDILTFYK